MICEAMNWAHLPVAGGVYDQDPELLEQWLAIWKVKAEVADEEKRKEAAAARNAASQNKMTRGSR